MRVCKAKFKKIMGFFAKFIVKTPLFDILIEIISQYCLAYLWPLYSI